MSTEPASGEIPGEKKFTGDFYFYLFFFPFYSHSHFHLESERIAAHRSLEETVRILSYLSSVKKKLKKKEKEGISCVHVCAKPAAVKPLRRRVIPRSKHPTRQQCPLYHLKLFSPKRDSLPQVFQAWQKFNSEGDGGGGREKEKGRERERERRNTRKIRRRKRRDPVCIRKWAATTTGTRRSSRNNRGER